MTKDEYIAFLESENARYYKEIQQLTYPKIRNYHPIHD